MRKYVKKPVVIEAVRWNGTNSDEMEAFIGKSATWCVVLGRHIDCLAISTLEGKMTANLGDWIIKGVNGEFYPCKPDIFEKSYYAYPDSEEAKAS
ncbi:MAG: hypothetical protein PHV34_05895 [Verrucomicrobiae bacterium]|nr:hypothetical protein [Verrucomicrobiae bacterium]